MQICDKEIIARLNLQYVMLNWWNVFCHVLFYDYDDGDYLSIKNIVDTAEAKELLKTIGLVDILYDDMQLVKTASAAKILIGQGLQVV